MTQWGYDEDNEFETQAGNNSELNGPKALRQAYEAQKKQIDSLTDKLTSFMEREEKQKMATVFETLGVPGAQSVYSGPADPDAAKAWVDTMRGVFGASNQGGTPPVADSTPAPQPTLPASMQAQYERFTEAGQHGTPQGNMDAAAAAVGDASNINDLIAAMQRANRMG